MNCIKPSGPYIAFLAIVLTISFVGIPKGETGINIGTDTMAQEKFEGEGLEQGEKITMLNIDCHE